MNRKIKNVFDNIHAEESLKNNTVEFINRRRTKKVTFIKPISVAAFFIIVCSIVFLGFRLYSTPVTALSLDANESIELEINVFDKVVNVTSFAENEDNFQFLDDIKHKNYKEAIEIISQSFTQDEILSITVAGKDEKHKNSVASEIKAFSHDKENVSFDMATKEEVEEAHEKGFSFGKHKAFLHLIEEGHEVTEEEIKNMTMKDIDEKRKNGNKGENAPDGSHKNEPNENAPDGNHKNEPNEDKVQHGNGDNNKENATPENKNNSTDVPKGNGEKAFPN